MKFKPQTDFLFSTPNLWVGIGSAFNVWGNYFLYNTSEDADRQALESDRAVIQKEIAVESLKIDEKSLLQAA